ncbi:hypothetical protein [Uliginosibacterium sp. 31-12]|uniref:hypothetical protein n=1 Tax=Uliginosibacterium sp. 31-12 TaxID=3062781 RepID=UPI0026E17F54|nr:hypothetical protein [Uliginosibacterium sp. 31-12]MDO6385028.1 hypothetical protein [Uliginosibacterium sp. 31-12]
MEHKAIKRIGAASLVALHLFSFPAWAQVCSNAEGLGAVFSVLKDGKIEFAGGSGDRCAITFYGASSVNTKTLNTAGSGSNGIPCKAYMASSEVDTNSASKSITKSDSEKAGPDLATFLFSTSSKRLEIDKDNGGVKINDVIVSFDASGLGSIGGVAAGVRKVGNQFLFSGTEFDSLYVRALNNGDGVVFEQPLRINNIYFGNNCNGDSGITFAQDGASVAEQSYIRQLDWKDGCRLNVTGPGRTTLNVLGKSAAGTVVGLDLQQANPCINWIGTCSQATKTWAQMDAQHPERLQINLYNGNLEVKDRFSISAGIYVPNGDLKMTGATGSSIVGEVLAKNVIGSQNNDSQFFSKSTSQAAPRVGAYSLTPPVTELITNKDSLVYRALQKDQPGTSGHLQAFKLKDDSSQNTTPEWDATDVSASKMSADNRLAKLRTETTNWASASTDFEALSNTASGATLAQACAVNPTQTACRITGDKRLATSMVGVPWRVAPLLLGDSVLFATDDGILYSVDKTNGNLNWGWIPRDVLAESQAALSSTPMKLMEAHPWGQIASVQLLEDDVSSTAGAKVTRTYVTGTALGGKLHFSIRVSNDGKSLDKVVWLDSRTSEYSPGSAGNTNDGEAGWSSGVYGRPYGGAAPVGAVMGGNKVAYVVGGKLVTREVNTDVAAVERNFTTGGEMASASSSAASSASSSATSSAASSVTNSAASVTPSSNLLYVDDNAIYFGAEDGKVYKTKSTGVIETGEYSVDKLRTYRTGGSASAVWYVNGSKIASASGNGLILLAQTKTHVTALKYFSDKWTFAWQTGINASTKLGESDPATNPSISVLASDNAYLSAPADIINGVVVLYYTKKPSECDIKGYTFGPLKLLDGTDARGNSQFRMTDMTSLDNYVGLGDATGGAFTRFKGKRAILAGTGGDPGNSGDTAAITPAENAFRERLNWRELTNFF